MIDLDTIRSLTDFQRNARKYIRQMKKSGRPQVLTVNGKAQLVVQDAASYQRLLDQLDRSEAIEGVIRGLDDVKHGRTRPADAVFRDLESEHAIPRRNRRAG